MNMKYRYFFVYTLPLLAIISIKSEGLMSWFAVLFVFGFLPLVELFLKDDPINEEEDVINKSTFFFNFVLYSLIPIHLCILFTFLFEIQSGFAEMTTLTFFGKTISMGIVNTALGINLAHELGHRRNKHDQDLALVLLATSLYMHFFIEHNRGHHKNVSTPLDHASAEKGINLYSFLSRSIFKSFLSAYKIDKKQTLQFVLIQSLLLVTIGLTYGLPALGAFVVTALVGILLLEAVNYIEHYGLERILNPNTGRYEKVQPHHSWNSSKPLSRVVLLELSRHSDHHANADRPYQLLRHFGDAPQLPTGYPGMVLLATIPFLWFKVMDPRTPGNNPV